MKADSKTAGRRLVTCAVILTAGEGSRLGSVPKALIEIAGETLVARLITTLQKVGIKDLIAVTGHYSLPIMHELLNLPITVTEHPDNIHTQQDSLRLGLKALKRGFNSVMVVPVDMPCLTETDLSELIDVYENASSNIAFVGPVVHGLPGNPVIFNEHIAEGILHGDLNVGNGKWRQQQSNWLLEWHTGNDHYLIDIDTPGDLAQWSC